MLDTLVQDLRYGLRALRKTPGLTAAAVLSLALAIGANTTVYTWMDRFVLRPLPMVEGVDRLVTVNTKAPGGDEWSVSIPELTDWRAGTRSMDLAGFSVSQLGLRSGSTTERIYGLAVTSNFFTVLGLRPYLGRFLTAGEETAGEPVAVLGYSFWKSQFQGDSAVLSRAVVLNGTPVTVVGIAPPRFGGAIVGLTFDLYFPVNLRYKLFGGQDPSQNRGWQFLNVVGRPRPGFSFEQGRADLVAVSIRASEAAGSQSDRLGALVRPFNRTGPSEWLRPVFTALLGITGVILLIACANVANLLLARAQGRQREIAIRLAIGAGRARLVRQLLTESLTLAGLAGIVGILIAVWARGLMMSFIPRSTVPIAFEFRLSAGVIAFALAVTLVTAVAFGLVPALQASRPNLVTSLKDQIGGGPGHRGRLQSALVVAQVALSLVSLVSAGLFVRSLAQSRSVQTGFGHAEGVLLVDTDLSLAGYRDSSMVPVVRRLLAAVRAVPGVESASLANQVPLGFEGGSSNSIEVPGYQPRPTENMSIGYAQVAGDYFRTMETPILRGRAITDDDRADGMRVAVVNEIFARRFFAGREAVGAQFTSGGPPITIVGVAQAGRYRQLNETPQSYYWQPWEQRRPRGFTIHVRARGEPSALAAPLRRAFAEVSADIPFLDVRTLAEHTEASFFAQRMGAWMLTGFGLLALALSSIGIYGVTSYSVSRRTREIGVRVALGAGRRDVIRLVVGRAMGVAGIGLGVGALAAVGAGQLLRSQLTGVSPRDPVTFGAIGLVLAFVALAACWMPARRAARVDPMVALRYE
jgi:predicted permease